jgi:PAS domain S-box-containing protein
VFRVTEPEVPSRFAWAVVVLVAVILAAALVTARLTWMLEVERATVAELAERSDPATADAVQALSSELRWQFRLAVIVLGILLATIVALIVMLRVHLASRRKLREVKVLAGDILASMDQAVTTTDCQGIVTSINPRGRELLDVAFECVGKPLTAISRGDIALDVLRREVLSTGQAVSDREFSVVRDGHALRLRSDCHLLRDTNRDVLGTVLHVRDVTERVLIEERIRRMERHGELGSLAAGLHHEIKNPLTALSLHVQLLDERLAEEAGSPAVEVMLGVIKTEVTRLNGVLDTFRSFASLRSLSLQPTDVLRLVDKSVRLLQPQAERQSVRISVTAEPELPRVPLDAPKFEQMLLNLIINGLEAMPRGGDLVIRLRADAKELCLEVADAGAGIPADVQRRIFDPYFTTKREGAGMGLAWSEKIAQMHQGHIEFRTGPQGTTFAVTIPLASPPPPERTKA